MNLLGSLGNWDMSKKENHINVFVLVIPPDKVDNPVQLLGDLAKQLTEPKPDASVPAKQEENND